MVFETSQERHRPGVLKQQNKAHKHGRHRSKGAIDSAIKGRTSAKVFTKKARHELRKEERRNKASQIRQKKRDEILFRKRSLGGGSSAPFLIAVISLCDDIDPLGAVEFLKQADEEAVVTQSREGILHISIPRFKQRFSVMVPLHGDLYSILDALKVADTVLFLVSACQQHGVDAVGEKILTSSLAQGLPSTIVAVMDLDSLPPKKRHDGKQNLQKALSCWLPDEKIMTLSQSTDGLAILRRTGSQKQRSVNHRDVRPHLFAEIADYTPDAEGSLGTLKVTGYVRYQPMCVNSLVHIPGWGDFQMSQIDAAEDPHPLEKGRKGGRKDVNETMDEDERVLEIADPVIQESLQTENIPDPMEGEQTWPTEEELAEAEEQSRAMKRRIKKVPKGMSEYQAAWIPDSDAEEVDISEDDECGMNVDLDAVSEENTSDGEQADEGEFDTVTMTDFGVDAERYDERMDLMEEEETMKKIKEARMEQLFPDELDTPMDTPARVRFQKYRGLKSFRTSPWDPKENLPSEYSRIFQFENFDRTRKRIMKEESKEGVLPGWYVTVHVIGVPQHLFNSRRPNQPLVLCGMLPHEQKMSVLNFVVRHPNVGKHTQQPVRAKEQLIFHCGYRRFKACPIFSQHTNGTKHKYERFFRPEGTVVASVFAPIMFPPSSVLVYKEMKDHSQELVATGHLLSVNPDRIIAKRVVLSGHLFKVNKRSAVVRFMFFNREDIEWFKPVELRTKYGRRGHIREPLGTHGHMKCVFDGQLKSQDTVLMNIYKRVFPKWTYEPYVNVPQSLYDSLVVGCDESMN
ncbi:pre-rRNA-processing protein TSR1 homolog [Zootermopsis nevadensis]|uniref:Pre-rRNA-processing protein TSR1 homolog n=1 Tax=Zootermopsis nevadensis TaxID=136037 RepID=A0A067RP15_ZOONE|nr:pre-rRNA-processing protein TSR1 homolog [Zootermopsis nevadensis]KDR22360.1 Pre-rRNA-processing protein TSR1-like protein [Zootermopsis nevadensis]